MIQMKSSFRSEIERRLAMHVEDVNDELPQQLTE